MNKLIASALVSALALSPTIAEAKKHHAQTLSPAIQLLAADFAKWRGVARLCRGSDGANLNPIYWQPKRALIPQSQMALFARTVKNQTNAFVAANNTADVALRCDDWMDDLRADFDSADPINDLPPLGPVCFDEPLGLWRCQGTGELDPFAGFDAILDGDL
jgi:hypothetical protein